ncbi:Uu.00g133900.m01.CDS01 [Anthostomella pinea]|uniref:Uu.00g133900.m01.CDS01 n=1 Tax=Anthostomella pinea TaxID=933095 RepID=A0AAI8VNU1_9PEZI|nr:Uu.00g133900.m01.CDS01 [Anthostomella pinea]
MPRHVSALLETTQTSPGSLANTFTVAETTLFRLPRRAESASQAARTAGTNTQQHYVVGLLTASRGSPILRR